MSDGFKFSVMTPAEEAAEDAHQNKLWDREHAERLNAPTQPVHENLKAFRVSVGLTKRETAEIMKVTERAYFAYEKGSRTPPTDKLINLAVVTECDLNEIMLGRPARLEQVRIEKFFEQVKEVQANLVKAYPTMDALTQLKVARFAVTQDWRPFYSSTADPGLIRDAVILATDYRFHPEEAPAPPDPEHFADSATYESAIEEWFAGFGPRKNTGDLA